MFTVDGARRTIVPAVIETVLLVLLQANPGNRLPKFYARKICHGLTGIILQALDTTLPEVKVFVHSVTITSLTMLWAPSVPNWRFGRKRDVGMTFYLCLLSVWCQAELSYSVLMPLFYADPAGALVGKFASQRLHPRLNPVWIHSKTFLGSLAVFVVAYLSLQRPVVILHRLLTALGIAVAEGLAGDYDNIAISAITVVSYFLSGDKGL
mmetsp:Transcript_288/g.944  ORF Transcript_288/g.944 Transcript_288/m.944 type:complete len:209 (-) Transcript_288:97-723(-)